VQLNVQYTDSYRQYNPELPAFLRNRPRDFVQHVQSRWTSAGNIPEDNITQLNDRQFRVTSSDTDNVYNVSLGELDSMPACDCYDWARYHWPCKHMLAIFQHGVKTWDDLCPAYRDSPFFTLDTELFDEASLPTPATNDVIGHTSDVETEVVSGPCDDGDEPRSGVQSVSSIAARCREHLRWLVDATYTCTDRDALLELEQMLEHGRDSMQLALPQDAGIILHQNIPTRTQVRKRLYCLPITMFSSIHE